MILRLMQPLKLIRLSLSIHIAHTWICPRLRRWNTGLKSSRTQFSDWQAALRIRIEGCDSVAKRARELNNTSKEFWRMKAEVADLLLKDLATCLIQCFPLEVERGRVHSELTESFAADAVVGVCPQGAPLGFREEHRHQVSTGFMRSSCKSFGETCAGP